MKARTYTTLIATCVAAIVGLLVCLRSLNLPVHLCTDRGPHQEETSELSQTKGERRAFLRYSAIHRVKKKAQMSMNSQGEKMENEDHGGKQDQLEEHSLPGTNQAGKV